MSENKKHIEALKLACVGYPLKESTLSVAISALKKQERYEALRDAAFHARKYINGQRKGVPGEGMSLVEELDNALAALEDE